MKVVIKCVLLVLFFISMQTEAEGYEVARIYPQGGKVFFRLKNDPCKNAAANKYWYFDLNNEVAKAWFSMLLSAAATKTKVQLGYNSCDPDISQPITYVYQDF